MLKQGTFVGIHFLALKPKFIVLYDDIVIQITLRSNHHYAKLNDINKVCQQKFGHAFSHTHLLALECACMSMNTSITCEFL